MSSDVNPGLFEYVDEEGKHVLSIAMDGSIGLRDTRKNRYTFFPYAKVKILPPFAHGELVVDPGDANDYSGIEPDGSIVIDIKSPGVEQVTEQINEAADALGRYNDELLRAVMTSASLQPRAFNLGDLAHVDSIQFTEPQRVFVLQRSEDGDKYGTTFADVVELEVL